MHPSDHIRRVKESHRVRRHQHVQTHHRRRRPRQCARNRQPHQKVAREALHRPRQKHDPRPTAICGGGVEDSGKEPDVGPDVFAPRYRGERGLVVILGGFEDLGVDAEGVERASCALDPYAGGGGHPFVPDQGFPAGIVI